MEVKVFTQAGGVFELAQPMPRDVVIGDGFDVYAGCNKTIADCRDKFNNVINYRGEPYVPGSDYLTTYPNAK